MQPARLKRIALRLYLGEFSQILLDQSSISWNKPEFSDHSSEFSVTLPNFTGQFLISRDSPKFAKIVPNFLGQFWIFPDCPEFA